MEIESQTETEEIIRRPCCGAQVGADETIPDDLKEKMGRAPIGRHCDICFLLDGDVTPKAVMYCKLCDAFMCEPCRKNKWRRAGAAIARQMRKFTHGNGLLGRERKRS
ncbi:MAG TPA: hypothetical protein VKJ65_13625 [Phycisphaerae bacterium]|nr:hypothetical protein [Phycisphaerae bacterium]